MTKLERAEAKWRKAKAIRDVRKRQWQQAERDLTAATDELYAAEFDPNLKGK
jgi:hypothetical protein